MPENTPTAKDARSARRWCCCVLLAVLWCASLPLACLPGPVPVAVADVWQALGAVVGLCPPADGSVQLVVGQIRLARVLLGLLCGGALAVAGVALQGVLRNPLASASTLGVSQGATFGAAVAIIGLGLSQAGSWAIPLCSFLGSLLVAAVILGLSQFKQISSEGIVLAGVAISSMLTGATTVGTAAVKLILLVIAGLGFSTLWFSAFIDAIAGVGAALVSILAYNGEIRQPRGRHEAK